MVDEFIGELNGRKVICFGAGGTLIEPENSRDLEKINGLEDHIAFLVDNDKNKHGSNFRYRNRDFEIKSVSVLDSVSVKDYVLMITCEYFVEIYHQLKDVPNVKDMDCYLFKTVCRSADVDLDHFFTREIEKPSYKEWRRNLSDLHLKDMHKGKRCFIIGNGPSLKCEDLELIKNEISFAVNYIYRIFDKTDWRPTYYISIDTLCYPKQHKVISSLDVKMRFIPFQNAVLAGKVYDEVTYFNQEMQDTHVENNRIVVNEPLTFSEDIERGICCRYTVLYSAFQLAVYMGFSEIYLLGVDHNYSREILEDGTIVENNVADYFDGSILPVTNTGGETPLYTNTKAFRRAKEVCDQKGIVVKNATRGGKLEIFERVALEELF